MSVLPAKRLTTRFRHALLTATLILGGSHTAAAGVFYECDMKTKIPNGWISPKIGIIFDDAGQVTVIDSIILNFVGDPLKAKATRKGDKLRVTWNIANAKDAQGQYIPTFRYVANLNTKTKAISVSAKPVLAPQRWSAKGACKTRTR